MCVELNYWPLTILGGWGFSVVSIEENDCKLDYV
jgi:hypothetical protein